MQQHEEECNNRRELCDKCKCPYYINQKDVQHDCIEALKKKIKDKDKEQSKIKESFGVNYDVMKNRCNNGHMLKVHVGLVRKYPTGEPVCDACRTCFLHHHEFFYHCDLC